MSLTSLHQCTYNGATDMKKICEFLRLLVQLVQFHQYVGATMSVAPIYWCNFAKCTISVFKMAAKFKYERTWIASMKKILANISYNPLYFHWSLPSSPPFSVHSSTKYTDKKENEIFHFYKEIQMGAVSKSYMRKGFLIYEEMRKYLVIYEEVVATAPFWISLYMRKILFSFSSVYCTDV